MARDEEVTRAVQHEFLLPHLVAFYEDDMLLFRLKQYIFFDSRIGCILYPLFIFSVLACSFLLISSF